MDWSTPGRIILLFLAAYLILMVLLPLLYPYGSFTGLDGRSGVMENWDKLVFADPLTRVVYATGDLFCHQEESRSFMINGSQMAFCQRDTSILIGVISGLLVTDKNISRVYAGSRECLMIGIIFGASTMVEWTIEFASGADILAARVATGILSGIGIALLLQYIFTKQYERVNDFLN